MSLSLCLQVTALVLSAPQSLTAGAVLTFATPCALNPTSDACAVGVVYASDDSSARDIEALLEDSGFGVELLSMGSIGPDDLSEALLAERFEVLIFPWDLAPSNGSWSNAQLNTIRDARVPLLSMGLTGYYLYGEYGMSTGYPYGATGNAQKLYDSGSRHDIFTTPNTLPTDDSVTAYSAPVSTKGIYMPGYAPTDVDLVARVVEESSYTAITIENELLLYWSFHAGVESMTTDGRALFVNAVTYLEGLE